MSQEQLSKHPIDYDSINKGDYIPPDVCESILRTKRDHKKYSLRLCNLAKHIEKELRIRSRPATVVTEKDGITILTDADASRYAVDWRDRRYRGMKKDLRRLAQVDVNNIPEAERKKHDGELLLTGRMVQMLKSCRKGLPQPEAHKRIG